jgi:linoleate 10R-lipoxygenase
MKSLKREDDYTYERPTYIKERINVTSWEAAMAILNDGETFKVTWGAGLAEFMGKPGSDFVSLQA